MNNGITIAELVKSAQASAMQNDDTLMKTAHAQGIEDAERVIKVASYTGDIVGQEAFNTFHDYFAGSLGLNPEVDMVKQASIKDMIDYAIADSFVKIAETYSPQTGCTNLTSTVQSGGQQLAEAGKAHATLAVQAANDAAASVATGDPNTAAMSMQTAAENIALAQQANAAVADPELQSQVAQASAIVGQVATSLQQQA